ncbi:MAG: metallophosphoesterase family protein [Janthinobacterium lividum]
MAGLRFLHLADLHLDSPLRGLEAEAPAVRIREASRQALAKAVQFALDEALPLVVIAGDLFDGDWKDWRTGHFLLGQVARLTRAGVRVVAISGNHDADSVVSRKVRWEAPATLLPSERADTVRFPEIGVAVHGQSFRTREMLENLAAGYPRRVEGLFNIGLLHTAAEGHEGHANYAPCSVGQLAAHGYEYWALGHVHTRRVLHEDPPIVFPGNLQGRHVNEPGERGGTLVEVRDGRVALRHVAFDVVRWERLAVDVSGAADLGDAMALVRAAAGEAAERADGRLLALRVVLTGASAAHAALAGASGEVRELVRGELLAAAGEEAWLEGVQVATVPRQDRSAMRARTDAFGALVRSIEALDAGALAGPLQAYAEKMLGRAGGVGEALGEAHPAVRLAAGEVPEELMQRARALLMARLAEGEG